MEMSAYSKKQEHTNKVSDRVEHIIEAVNCEEGGFILEAIEQYEEGIQKLYELSSEDRTKKNICHKYIDSYQQRVQYLRHCVHKNILDGKLVKRQMIHHDARGQSYLTIFHDYLNNDVREVHIYEPLLNGHMHMKNIISFLEILAKHCRFLKYVRLFTKIDHKNQKRQLHALEQIAEDLASGNVNFLFRFDDQLFEPKIIFSNGIVVKIGRGLHYFQGDETIYNLGMCDYDFRKCLSTDVEVWMAEPFSVRTTVNVQDEDEAEDFDE